MSSFPERLKKLRANKKLSQRKLAEELGISGSLIALFETGKRDPGTDQLISMAKYFSCSVDFLLGISDDYPLDMLEEDIHVEADPERPITAGSIAAIIEAMTDLDSLYIVEQYGKLSPNFRLKAKAYLEHLVREDEKKLKSLPSLKSEAIEE